jgi:hypothetical protein
MPFFIVYRHIYNTIYVPKLRRRDRYDYQCFEADGIEVQKYLLKLSPFVNRQKVSTKIPP